MHYLRGSSLPPARTRPLLALGELIQAKQPAENAEAAAAKAEAVFAANRNALQARTR